MDFRTSSIPHGNGRASFLDDRKRVAEPPAAVIDRGDQIELAIAIKVDFGGAADRNATLRRSCRQMPQLVERGLRRLCQGALLSER